MKTALLFIIVCICIPTLFAQPVYKDSVGIVLKPQQNNIITAETILKVENLGSKINTALPELRPTISADGNLLFFICQNHPKNTKYGEVPNSQDIWFSERDSSGNWGKAFHVG